MITILHLYPNGEWSVNHYDVSFDEGCVCAEEIIELGGLTFVFDRKSEHVCRVDRAYNGTCFTDEARGFHLIWLYNKLTDGEPLYVFTLRPVARKKVLALVDTRWPMSSGDPTEDVGGPVYAKEGESPTLSAAGSAVISASSVGKNRKCGRTSVRLKENTP